MSSPLQHAQLDLEQANRAYADGQFDLALQFIDRAIAQNPQFSDALHLRGLIALAKNAPQEAQTWIARAVELLAHPVYCNSLCVAQTRLSDYKAAARSAHLGLEQAREHHPGFDTYLLWYNLGIALQLDDEPSKAAQAYREVLARQPGHSGARNNLGTVTKDLGDLDAAIAQFEQAIVLNPQNLGARSNLGHVLLAVGRYEDAWPHFEERWSSFQDTSQRSIGAAPQLPIAKWQGDSLPGERRLLVLHEQGYGDALQFCRYLPMLLDKFAHVGFVCPAPLRGLFEQSLSAKWPNLSFLDGVSDFTAWDAYCSLLSLPMLLGTTLDNLPNVVPYLHADPQRANDWAERLAVFDDGARPKVGIVWAGGHTGTSADARRSIAPEQFATLLSCGDVRWISLQKAEADSKKLPAAYHEHVIDWMDEVTDFADTAALIAGLDLVISVDTSVAHLAAAMGKPVWLLNRFAGCWRWLRDRDDSPWYPGLRLFTQQERGNWDEVLDRIRGELTLLSSRSSR